MNKTVNVTIRIEKELKEEAEQLFSSLGMNLTTAINVFLRQAVRNNGIPFDISANIKRPSKPQTKNDDLDDLEDLFQ